MRSPWQAGVPGHSTRTVDTPRYLVSRDNDLLDLMDQTKPEGKGFAERFPGLQILDPVAFLRALSPTEEGG
jgi:hypothetical protein